MHKDTGEVKEFPGNEKLPDNWISMPEVDTEVMVLFKERLSKYGTTVTKKRRGRVKEILQGRPGGIVIEMLPMKR